MLSLKLLKKAGGWELIKNWISNGVMGYSICQILLTGKSKKSLELLRNGVSLKLNRKLSKRYNSVLERFDEIYDPEHNISRPSDYIWFCWLQGIENAPRLVKICYNSVLRSFKDKEIVLLTENNILQYANIPKYIIEKYKKGYISRTHLSDLLRISLLAEHGGTWIDATVYCTDVPSYMIDNEFFVFQNLKPGADGSILNSSSWFMSSKSNNHIVLAIRELLWAYWKSEKRLIDYFLLHHFMAIVSERYPDEWNMIPKFPNSLPHVLLLSFFDKYDEETFNRVLTNSPVHKLSYKFSDEQKEIPNTNYIHFLNMYS